MKLSELYPELTNLVKGSSFKQLFDFFYTLGLVRYATAEQLRAVNFKLGTKKKLTFFTDYDFLAVNSYKVFILGQRGRQVLQEQGYNLQVISKNLQAEQAVHELKITDVLLRLMKQPFFYSVIYPTFNLKNGLKLIPDACIIWKKENKVKLQFLEVETEKGSWEQYLLEKKTKYEQLAKDEELHSRWWRHWCRLFEFNFCSSNEFGFSVLCIGNVRFKWNGWDFGEF